MNDSRVRLTRWLSLMAFALIAGGAIQPLYLRYLFADSARIEAEARQASDHRTETYVEFLREVKKRTASGDSIAILVPPTRWDDGYDYFYYRASYLLAGRTVTPLVDESGRILLHNLGSVTWIADWQVGGSVPRFRPVWSGAGGTLLRRVE